MLRNFRTLLYDRLVNGGVITHEQRGDAGAILRNISRWLEHSAGQHLKGSKAVTCQQMAEKPMKRHPHRGIILAGHPTSLRLEAEFLGLPA